MKSIFKWPLIIAAAVVVIRVILEESGAPSLLNNIFGVTWLYFLLPIYFAFQIAQDAPSKPYMRLFQVTVVFLFLTRLMVSATYCLAYVFSWSAPRFSVQGGGVVGEGVTPLQGLVLIPLQNLVIATIFGTVIAMIIGSIVLAIRRRLGRASQQSD